MKKLSFKERIALSSNPTAKKIFHLIEEKQSNLALAADFTSSQELLDCANALGPHICILKTHIDILEDFTFDVISTLLHIAKKHRFLLFEDRKFADIGNTVASQYGKGIYKIANWADITNAHIVPGPGIITGLKKIGLPLGRGLLLLAEMSSQGALTDKTYAEHAVKMALHHSDFVIGFISQRQLLEDPRFLHLTPGIHLKATQDTMGQQYRTVDTAITSGSDILIVGRAIYEAEDATAQASLYREEGWKAYASRIG